MKKWIALLILLFCISIQANAQDYSGWIGMAEAHMDDGSYFYGAITGGLQPDSIWRFTIKPCLWFWQENINIEFNIKTPVLIVSQNGILWVKIEGWGWFYLLPARPSEPPLHQDINTGGYRPVKIQLRKLYSQIYIEIR